MHRYSSYDPPEYVRWVPDPDLVDRYERSPEEYPDKAEAAVGIEEAQRVALYRDLVLTRLHDIVLKRWVRHGVLSKACLGTGEEAVTVSSVSR